MADPILAFDEQRVSYTPEFEGVVAIRPIDLAPPQGNTDPQTHVLVSLTG